MGYPFFHADPKRRIGEMTAYEFYWRDDIKGFELVGILPERRTNPERITEESVLRLGRTYIGENADARKIFFIQVIVNSGTGEISRPFLRS